MKKRLPTLVVFGAAVMVFMFILFWPSISPPSPTLDSDKDGYPDKIDNCPNVPSNINNGCPENIGEQIDEDQDGRYAGFQKDSILFDKNDKNPCIPNEKCKFCEYKPTKTTNLQLHYLNKHATKEERQTGFKYYCDKCDFGCFVSILYERHLETQKHLN